MNFIRSLILIFVITFSSLSYGADFAFNPNLVVGAGPQFGEDQSFYIAVKSYLIEPKKWQDTDLLGLGIGINTLGDIQLLVSPIGWTFFESFQIAPDIAIGMNRSEEVQGGISIGFVF